MQWLDTFVEIYSLKPIALFIVMVITIIILLCIDSDKALPKEEDKNERR